MTHRDASVEDREGDGSVQTIVRRVERGLGFGVEHVPPLVVAFGVAEVAYKFHSFALEAGAFLLTWRALDWAYGAARGALRGRGEGATAGLRA